MIFETEEGKLNKPEVIPHLDSEISATGVAVLKVTVNTIKARH